MNAKQLGWIAPTPELVILHCHGRRQENLSRAHVLNICHQELPSSFGWWQKLWFDLSKVKGGHKLTLETYDSRFCMAAMQAESGLLYSSYNSRILVALTLSSIAATIHETVYLCSKTNHKVNILSEDTHLLIHPSESAVSV